MDTQHLLAKLAEISVAAGREIMAVYNRPGSIDASSKADDSPVTEADERADALIAAALRESFPDIQIVTEEQVESHGQAQEVFFLVDPLDGTKEFVKKRGDFTVNIALVKQGEPVAGVVYAPARGRIFTGAVGYGAFEGDEAARTPINVATPDNAGLRVVASKSHRDAETDQFISKFDVAEVRSAGSSLKFCLVATGEADLYPRMGRTMEWDTAAGHAVVAAAGGRVVRADTLEPLRYGKPGWDNPKFIVYAPGVATLD